MDRNTAPALTPSAERLQYYPLGWRLQGKNHLDLGSQSVVRPSRLADPAQPALGQVLQGKELLFVLDRTHAAHCAGSARV